MFSEVDERFEYAIELPGKGFASTAYPPYSSIVPAEEGFTLFNDYEEAVKQYAILRRRYETMGAEAVGRKLVIRKRRIVTTNEGWNQIFVPSKRFMKDVLTTPAIRDTATTNAATTEGDNA